MLGKRTALCIIVVLALAAGTTDAHAATPHLFIDDAEIASGQFKRTFHQPVKDPGVVVDRMDFDTPATLEANGTIVYDPKLKRWVMFALGYSSSAPFERARLYRYTSRDALNWDKGQRIMLPTLMMPDVFSAYYDAGTTHPYKAWLHLWDDSGVDRGTYYVRSVDGVVWEIVRLVMAMDSTEKMAGGHAVRGPGDVNSFSYDPVSKRFLGSFKFYSHALLGEHGSRIRSRGYGWLSSIEQPVDMAGVGLEFVPDAAGSTEFYGSTAWRYGDMLLGGLKVYDNADGRASLRLASSRDGLAWNDHGAFLTNSAEGTEDGGYMTEFSQGPLRIGNELVFYYGSSAWGKNHAAEKRVTGGGIFRARLRVDGFASVRGTVTMKVMRFAGRRLTVNYRGRLTVTVLDSRGRKVGERRLVGDALAQSVSVRLPSSGRIRFQGGDLYSYTVA